ncbi:hypothetical protein TNCV_1970561 [Trichonephila clavipes]|uniref:Uncharacterized protein n=1 Tax=Trichonephila clavipes TaxID=2585209 RepID=A0A8X6W5T9_TRICX|nr:hypothetical protein TNCV_1970561 [Trichonephila clavipes]
MSSFLVLGDGDTRNRWRDGQVCPDVGQGTMAPWARRLGREKKSRGENGRKEKKKTGEREETEKDKKKSRGERRVEPALYGEKG